MTVSAASNPHPLIAVMEDRAWILHAVCRGRAELFFEPFREIAPDRERREDEAKALCAVCPVQLPCREAGRRNHESGIWGGETEEDRALAGVPLRTIGRRGVLRARRSVAPAPASANDVA